MTIPRVHSRDHYIEQASHLIELAAGQLRGAYEKSAEEGEHTYARLLKEEHRQLADALDRLVQYLPDVPQQGPRDG